jgi:hypothetical protein
MGDPGPSDGHQFHFAVTVQGSYQIVGDPQHYDCEPDPEADPFTLTVRAWCLADACRVAAEVPFSKWRHSYEEGNPS